MLLLRKALDTLKSLFSDTLLRLIGALLILLIGFILGRILGKFTQKILNDMMLDKTMRKLNIHISLEGLIGLAVSICIYLLSIAIAVNTLGLTKIVLYIIIGIGFIALIISSLIAIKNFIPNVMAGFSVSRMIKEGQSVTIGRLSGKVKKIGILETEIDTNPQETIYIPNSAIIGKNISIVKEMGKNKIRAKHKK